jgi:hypothetical protein
MTYECSCCEELFDGKELKDIGDIGSYCSNCYNEIVDAIHDAVIDASNDRQKAINQTRRHDHL